MRNIILAVATAILAATGHAADNPDVEICTAVGKLATNVATESSERRLPPKETGSYKAFLAAAYKSGSLDMLNLGATVADSTQILMPIIRADQVGPYMAMFCARGVGKNVLAPVASILDKPCRSAPASTIFLCINDQFDRLSAQISAAMQKAEKKQKR